MTGKDMLKGIQNLDATLIEEAEFGEFRKNQAGISGKKKLLFLLAAILNSIFHFLFYQLAFLFYIVNLYM